MQKKALIVLTKWDKADIRLVDPVAQKWIESTPKFHPARDTLLEQLPKEMQGIRGQYSVMITRASYVNDRASACHGVSFDRFIDLLMYIRENEIEVVYEFAGFIY